MSDELIGDAKVRAAVDGIAVPEIDHVAATTAPPLRDARVAVVTTAGLRPAGEHEFWAMGDSGFTVLDGSRRDFSLNHMSPNFDRSGFAADVNVVAPLDRLAEMAAAGEIGSVSDVLISFMGAQPDATLSTILIDTGPAAAKVLQEDGVDVVVLTPV